MFDWITKIKKKKEERTQLYFYADGDFEFRKLPVEYTELVEYENGKPIRWFAHKYALEYAFDGFDKISADMVTLGFSRDVVLDPFGILESDKSKSPKNEGTMTKGTGLKRQWITDRADNARYIATQIPSTSPWWDKIATPLGIAVGILAVVFAIRMFVR